MEAVTVSQPVQVQPQLEDPRNRPKKKMSLESDSDEDDDASAQNLYVKKELEHYINEPTAQASGRFRSLAGFLEAEGIPVSKTFFTGQEIPDCSGYKHSF